MTQDTESAVLSGWRRFLSACAYVNGIIVLALAFMIGTDVLVRLITGRPLVGVYELAQILFVPLIFLVIPHVQMDNRQLRVEMLVALVPRGKAQQILKMLNLLAALCFFGILLRTATIRWIEAVQGRHLGMGMISVPTAIPISFLLLGTILMCVTLAIMLLAAARRMLQREW